MATKTKKIKKVKRIYHWHTCGDEKNPGCGRWQCDKPNCKLSSHAHCGQKVAGDLAVCIKTKKFVPPLTFEAVAQRRISEGLNQRHFLNECCRLDLDAPTAKAKLREYRFQLRRLTKQEKRVKV